MKSKFNRKSLKINLNNHPTNKKMTPTNPSLPKIPQPTRNPKVSASAAAKKNSNDCVLWPMYNIEARARAAKCYTY